jgi:hypothetical protein
MTRVNLRQMLIWSAVAILGAVAWGFVALARGERINAIWLIFAALCSYAIAYRFYARVERPMLSLAPDGLSGAPPIRDRPALQVSYLSTRDRGAGHMSGNELRITPKTQTVEQMISSPAGSRKQLKKAIPRAIPRRSSGR